MSRGNVKIKLKNFAIFNPGQSPSSNYYSKSEGVPFLQGNRTFGLLYPKIDTYTKNVTKLAQKGDVLISVRAPVGDLNFAKEEVCIGRGLAGVKALDDDNKFLYYCLKYNIQNLIRQGGGTTFNAITKDIMNDFDLIMPDLPEDRRKVSNILFDIDSKIELNNNINSRLKSLVKTIYEYWFVQYDFPDINGNPYKSSGGKMQFNNELGIKIPERWDVDELKFWIDEDKNGDWGKENSQGKYDNKVLCIRGTDINGLNGVGTINAPERFILEKNSFKILKPGDLIIEISGGSPIQSTGRIGYINDSTIKRFNKPIICSNFCRSISLPDKKYIYNFLLLWERLYENGVLFGWEGKTSGIKNLLFESFISNYLQPIPEYSLVEKFYYEVDPYFNKIQLNLRENEKLRELRDWLLPILMNGQVKVS